VLLLTASASWIQFVVAPCPSITGTAEQHLAAVKTAMDCAGLAVLLALLAWSWAPPFGRYVLIVSVLADAYTLAIAITQSPGVGRGPG
jgi:hypothetical protein